MACWAKIIIADSRKMPEIADETIGLIVTSPYWHLKDYGIEGQIGYGQSLHEYLLQDHSAACQGIFQCELIGFDYMGAIIWQKKTTMNSSGGATIMGSYPYPPSGMIERLRIHTHFQKAWKGGKSP